MGYSDGLFDRYCCGIRQQDTAGNTTFPADREISKWTVFAGASPALIATADIAVLADG